MKFRIISGGTSHRIILTKVSYLAVPDLVISKKGSVCFPQRVSSQPGEHVKAISGLPVSTMTDTRCGGLKEKDSSI